MPYIRAGFILVGGGRRGAAERVVYIITYFEIPQIIVTPIFLENEILHNFEQSKNTFLKKLITIIKYKDVFLICIVSNYCRKTILQIAVRQIVVNH